MLVEKRFAGGQQEITSVLYPSNAGHTNEKKFLISAAWWRKWCDYVNFAKNENNLDISRLSVVGDRKLSEEVVTFYEKPGKISNAKLLS